MPLQKAIVPFRKIPFFMKIYRVFFFSEEKENEMYGCMDTKNNVPEVDLDVEVVWRTPLLALGRRSRVSVRKQARMARGEV